MVGDAWNVLQRLRSVLSEAGNVAIQPPAQKTFDAEGEALEHLDKVFPDSERSDKKSVFVGARFRDATIKPDCKSDYPHALQVCGKRFLLTLVPFHVACQGSLGTHRPPIFMG
jgi:hypothetical protein